MLVGGAEGITRAGMGSFDRLGAADPVRCRPFDRNRAGTIASAVPQTMSCRTPSGNSARGEVSA